MVENRIRVVMNIQGTVHSSFDDVFDGGLTWQVKSQGQAPVDNSLDFLDRMQLTV